MKPFILVLKILLLFPYLSFGQKNISIPSLKMDFIENYPIKIDGGVSFFTHDTTSITDRKKDILIINAKKTAFIHLNGNFVFFKHIGRQRKKNNYIDKFQGKNREVLTLTMHKKRAINKENSEFAGQLTLQIGKNILHIPIHGMVDYLYE